MELVRWTKTDPVEERCDFIITDGTPCRNKAELGVSRCPMHGANVQLQAIEQKGLRMYRLAKHQSRINDLTDHSKLKSLREEIAILRLILE